MGQDGSRRRAGHPGGYNIRMDTARNFTLRDRLLAHFPDVSFRDHRIHVTFPDGRSGRLAIMTVRKGTAGSLSCVAQYYEGEDAPEYFLQVRCGTGQATFPVPPPEGDDAVAAALRDEELAKRVSQYVPAVQAAAFGARDGRKPRGGGL